MKDVLQLLLSLLSAPLRTAADRELEILALRQQLIVLKRRQPRVRLQRRDRAFWYVLSLIWPHWRRALLLVKPETVIRWHRRGFLLFWRRISEQPTPTGRPPIDELTRETITRLARENPLWGASRIHGELRALGFTVSERTVARYLPPRPNDARRRQSWKQFLTNHRDVICSMDLFTVPSLSFKQIYGFFIIDHRSRRVLITAATTNPTAAWIINQLRGAFPGETRYRYLIHDNDPIFCQSVRTAAAEMGLQGVNTSVRSPWQNGIAERWIGTCRRELLDHVIVGNQAHLARLLTAFAAYYNDDRTHRTLDKATPDGLRGREPGPFERTDSIVRMRRVAGLHSPYERVRCA